MRQHILIVDDNEQICTLFADVLESSGKYRVSTALSGAEALLLVERDPPDVAVIDAVMPGLSGMTVAMELRERGIAVALMTGEPTSMEALDRSDWLHLDKPFGGRDLLEAIEMLLAAAESAGGRDP